MIKQVTLWACLLCASFSFAKQTHVTTSGESLTTIANDLGLTVDILRTANPGLENNILAAGIKIEIPDSIQVTVGKYDTDWIIASKFRITTAELKKSNPDVDFSDLKEGQLLTVPIIVRAASKPVPASSPIKAVKTAVAAAKTPAAPTKTMRVTGDTVRVRATASTSGRIVDTVDQGSIGLIIETKSGWHKLKFTSGLIGWIKADFLASGSAKPVIAKAAPKKVASKLPDVRNTEVAYESASKAASLLGTARSFLGVRYVYGGTNRSGIDCSGFVGAVFKKHGINLPRTAAAQAGRGTYVSRGGLKAGDLIFFRTGRSSRISHVGIYIGNGNMIHASSGSGRVRIDTLSKSYYQRTYATARRVGNFGGSVDFSQYKPTPGSDIGVSEATIEDIEPSETVGTDEIGR
ncbi:MAG: C40 family peptidase [Chthonomonas sp.]|nr:C40 family peptidase [Chthonomonas sp.]